MRLAGRLESVRYGNQIKWKQSDLENISTETINKIETEHHEYGSSGNKDVEETEILTGSKSSLSRNLNHYFYWIHCKKFPYLRLNQREIQIFEDFLAGIPNLLGN